MTSVFAQQPRMSYSDEPSKNKPIDILKKNSSGYLSKGFFYPFTQSKSSYQKEQKNSLENVFNDNDGTTSSSEEENIEIEESEYSSSYDETRSNTPSPAVTEGRNFLTKECSNITEDYPSEEGGGSADSDTTNAYDGEEMDISYNQYPIEGMAPEFDYYGLINVNNYPDSITRLPTYAITDKDVIVGVVRSSTPRLDFRKFTADVHKKVVEQNGDSAAVTKHINFSTGVVTITKRIPNLIYSLDCTIHKFKLVRLNTITFK